MNSENGSSLKQNTKIIKPIFIVGAGLAGLAAGIVLKEAGLEVKILEAGDKIGGRVQTDNYQGFLLDRGFQVFLKSYPEAKRFLDFKKLEFRSFLPGAGILKGNKIEPIMDPIRKPFFLFSTLFSSIGSFSDKWKMLKLKMYLSFQSIESIFLKPETTTLEYLSDYGFGPTMINEFFVPFLGGIFLEKELKTSSRMFEFVFKLFGEGDTAIPFKGMGMFPEQMAERFGKQNIYFNEKVLSFKEGFLKTEKNLYAAETIFFAGGSPFQWDSIQQTGYPYGEKANNSYLTKRDFQPVLEIKDDKKNIDFLQKFKPSKVRSAYTFYFSSPLKSEHDPLIILNPNKNQVVGTLAFMESVSEFYAPKGFSLISITLKDPFPGGSEPEIAEIIKNETRIWLPEAINWSFLKAYYIDYALPDQDHVVEDRKDWRLPGSEDIYLCGDFMLNGSINAALKSGRLAAEQYLKSLT